MSARITHFLLVDYGKHGRVFAETDPCISFTAVVDLVAEYDKVDAVYCADGEAGTWRDVTRDLAEVLAHRAWDELGASQRAIVQRYGLEPDESDEAPELDGHAHQRREAMLMGHFDA